MVRVKRRIFSGVVCEQEVMTIKGDGRNVKDGSFRPRFKTPEEREAHRQQIARRRHQQLVNENFDAASLYSTLTLDNDHEVHTFQEAKKIRDRYFRRLKYAYPDAVIFIYMGRGKNTSRIHYHMLSSGIPKDAIIEKWGQGEVNRVDQLRAHNYYNGVDHGQDYTGLANYLFDHWTPEQGGHRYKHTKNAKQPQKEAPTIVKRQYTAEKPPRAPKGYMLVDAQKTQYGYLYFKYVKIPPKRRRTKAKEKS